MCAGAPPSSPDPLLAPPLDPLPSVVVAPSDPVAMPSSPPPAAPAAAEDDDEDEDEERPRPPMKMKLFPYAMYCVFGGMGRTGEQLLVAYVVILYLNVIVNLLSFYTDGQQARFWTLVSRITQSLSYGSTWLIVGAFMRYYMRVDGVYVMYFDPPQQQPARTPAAADEQLPPPPPEMDMC